MIIRVTGIKASLDENLNDLREFCSRKLKIDSKQIKSASLFKKSVDARKKNDVNFILSCDFVIVNTAGKDLGTIFEAGFSYAFKKPIIYYFKAPDGVNFNLMLANSGVAVAKNKQQLIDILNTLKSNNFDFEKLERYEGNIE